MYCSTSIIAAIIAVVFFICKFFEIKFFAKTNTEDDENEKEDDKSKPLKEILRDTILVYISVWIGGFVIDQFPSELGGKIMRAPPIVFTDPPNF